MKMSLCALMIAIIWLFISIYLDGDLFAKGVSVAGVYVSFICKAIEDGAVRNE